MRNTIAIVLVGWGACLLSQTPVRAQPLGQGFGQNNGGFGQNGGFGGGFGQNNYNPQTQPLSPYLNLLRGNNSAVNYYNFARPGLPSGGFGQPFFVNQGSFGRQTFFPNVDTLYELKDAKPGDGMPPTGHPFGFNNYLGYYGGSQGGQRNQSQGQSPAGQKKGR